MSSAQHPSADDPSGDPIHGVLAEFSQVDALLAAARQVRDAGFRRWDTHTPFPVHGLDAAMGVRPTKLPWFILASGLTGLLSGLALQYWTMAIDYPFRISGKPLFSLPAFVPVCFELTVLFSAFAAIFGCFATCRLPNLFNPLFRNARFRRVTNDKFFIYIEAKDPNFDRQKIERLFAHAQADAVEPVFFDEDGLETRLPAGLTGMSVLLVAILLVPLAMIARARESTSELPRIHANPPAPIRDDMDLQPKFKPQTQNWFFADRLAMRAWPTGAVAQEDPVVLDTAYLTGKTDKASQAFMQNFPEEMTVNQQTMHLGQARFNTYCTPCHGLSGHGDGLVARRAEELQQGTWVAPTSLHDKRVQALPVGDIFNTITHGVRNMPAYSDLIDVEDRWAIVMYVKALQLSQNAPKQAVPERILPTLQ